MATYYVNKSGSDSTGDGLSSATAWLTIGKAIGSSPAITMSGSGDTLRIGPGIYYESVSLGLSPSSGNVLTVEPDGGLVEWLAWTDSSTQATTAALEASGKSYVTLRGMRMVGGAGSGQGSCLNVAGTWSDWTVENCEFIGGITSSRPNAVTFATSSASAINLTVRRCDFIAVGASTTFACLIIRSPLNASEYSLNALVENCRCFGGSMGIGHQQSGGTGTAWSTGVRVQQCTLIGSYRGVIVLSSPALTTPVGVYGSAFLNCQNGIVATTSGQIVEDGNYLWCLAPRTNVDVGTHSDSSSAPRFNVAVERITSGNPRPFGEPLSGSSMIGTGGYGTPPSVDIYNQTRPGSVSAGALERDTFDTPIYIFNSEG